MIRWSCRHLEYGAPRHGNNGTLSIIGIGKEVKLDLTTLWLKLQTVKGCYGYRYNHIESGRKHAYEMALD